MGKFMLEYTQYVHVATVYLSLVQSMHVACTVHARLAGVYKLKLHVLDAMNRF